MHNMVDDDSAPHDSTINKPWYEQDAAQIKTNSILVSLSIPITHHITVQLLENQSTSSDLLGSVLWPGGTALSTYIALLVTQPHLLSTEHALDLRPTFLQNKHVVELGSGVGILGIAAAMLGCRSVTLTDMNECLPLLCQNIQHNFSQFDSQTQQCTVRSTYSDCTDIRARPLEWSTEYTHNSLLPLDIRQHAPYDVIIMSDVVYDGYRCDQYGINNHDRLYATVDALSDEHTTILLQYTERREEEKRFFELLRQKYVWCSVRAVDCLPVQYHNTHIDDRLVIYSIKKTRLAQCSVLRGMQGRVTCDLLRYLEAQYNSVDAQLDSKLNERLCQQLSSVSCSETPTVQCNMCDNASKHCVRCEQCNMTMCRSCDRQFHIPLKFRHHVRLKV